MTDEAPPPGELVRYPKETPGFLRLPRSVEPLDDCGSAISWVRCKNHGDGAGGHTAPRPLVRTCGRRECAHERCDGVWKSRLADAAASRVAGGLLCWDGGQAIHVVVSPPPALGRAALQTLRGYKKLRLEAARVARLAGMRGGCVIVHPWRCKYLGRGRYERAARSGALEFSPHYHVVGGGWVEWTLRNYQATGWVVKNLKKRKSVAGTIAYLAGHCGVVPSVPTITYFGFCHPANTNLLADAESTVAGVCECGGTLVETDATLQEDYGTFWERVVHRSYAATGKRRILNRWGERLGAAIASDGQVAAGWIGMENARPGSPAWFAPAARDTRLDSGGDSWSASI